TDEHDRASRHSALRQQHRPARGNSETRRAARRRSVSSDRHVRRRRTVVGDHEVPPVPGGGRRVDRDRGGDAGGDGGPGRGDSHAVSLPVFDRWYHHPLRWYHHLARELEMPKYRVYLTTTASATV